MLFMTSTSGDESSTEMQKWREQGLRAIDEKTRSSLYFAEFSPPSTLDPLTVDAWLLANPAIGHTLTVKVLEAEAEQPNRNAFLRSSVNLWTASANGWLQPGVWENLKTDLPMPAGGVLAIEQSQDECRFVGVRAAINANGTHTGMPTVCERHTCRMLGSGRGNMQRHDDPFVDYACV
jgi:phage terminase large subunit-like protein